MLAGLALLLAAACGDEEPQASDTATIVPTNQAVAPGVTRGGVEPTVAAVTGVGLERAFAGLPELQRPVELVQVPGEETFLLVSQDGFIIAFEPGDASTYGTAYDAQDSTSRDGNEEGLLGFALDPAYPGQPYAYLYYNPTGGERRTVLSRVEVAGSGTAITIDEASELVILEIAQPYPNHNGGKVAFGPDGMLYLGVGDGGSGGDPHGYGQSTQGELFAGILRIDVRGASAQEPYTVPADNPFVPGGAGEPEIYAWGLRNPWRFSFDRQAGTLWVGDVGQEELEEIDIVERAGNYGWSVMEGDQCFEASRCDSSGLALPVATYPHDKGCSVTGGFVYRGEAIPGLRGTYLYSDFCSGTIWGLEADAATSGEQVEPVVLLESGLQIASFGEDAAGELYVLAFNGNVYRVVAE